MFFLLPFPLVLRDHKAGVQNARIGFWCAFGGFAAVVLGVTTSGGIGPCGPQHPGPFLGALLGLAAFAVGILMLMGGFFQAAFRKSKVSASSDPHRTRL